jgi:hypothetical protein
MCEEERGKQDIHHSPVDFGRIAKCRCVEEEVTGEKSGEVSYPNRNPQAHQLFTNFI